jgi:hypothetical protein
VIARGMATDEAALEIRCSIEEHRRPFKRCLPSLPHEFIDHSTGLSAEMASQLELALTQDANSEDAGGYENGVRGVSGIEAESEKRRIEADLGDPCGRKGISLIAMSDSDDVQSIGEASKELEGRVIHMLAASPSGSTKFHPFIGRPLTAPSRPRDVPRPDKPAPVASGSPACGPGGFRDR